MKRIGLFFFFISQTLALSSADLYKTTFPVQDKENTKLSAILSTAMENIFIKASGNSQIIKNNKILAEAVKQAENYVETYFYQANSEIKTDPANPYLFTATFPLTIIDDFLIQAGQKVWKTPRPSLIAWIAVKDTEPPRLLNAGEQGRIETMIKNIAIEKRGIELFFPQMDLTDVNQISIDEVLKNNISAVQLASQRYAQTAILIGTLIHSSDTLAWESTWTLVLDSNVIFTGSFSNPKVDALIYSMLNEIADALHQHNLGSDIQTTTQLTLSQVKTLKDFVNVTQTLNHIAQINQLNLNRIKADRLEFQVNLQGSAPGLQAILNSIETLTPVPSSSNLPENTARLSYRWSP